MKPFVIPADLTGKAMFDFIVKNEALIIHAKKIKKADSVVFSTMFVDDKGLLVSKAEGEAAGVDTTKLKAVVVINTTNWFDSHYDVHIPGLWKKSLADNKKNGFYLLNRHSTAFEDVIAEGCKGSTKQMTWQELGYDIAGETEALLFNGVIEKDRNPFMFGQYQKSYVKNHSVGMQYVRIVTCINDDDYPVQKENWNKYFPMVANKDDAEESGFFWAILEAKVREGSAVLFGSNCMTPTYLVEEVSTKTTEVKTDTTTQPDSSTEEQPLQESFSISKILQII